MTGSSRPHVRSSAILTDPQSVTISGVAISLPRTSSGAASGAFTANDQNTALSVSHAKASGGRTRHLVRLDNRKIAADPLTAGVNVISQMSAYLVIESPQTGYSIADQKAVVDAFVAFLAAGTGAVVTKVLGNEI